MFGHKNSFCKFINRDFYNVLNMYLHLQLVHRVSDPAGLELLTGAHARRHPATTSAQPIIIHVEPPTVRRTVDYQRNRNRSTQMVRRTFSAIMLSLNPP